MRKIVGFLGGLVGLFSILAFVPGLEFLSWWTLQGEAWLTGTPVRSYIDAFGFWHPFNQEPEYLTMGYTLCGILALLGSLVMFAASIKEKGAILAIAGVVTLVAPVLFSLVHINDPTFTDIASFFNVDNTLFGSMEEIPLFLRNILWYPGFGFFAALLGGLLGIVGAGGGKK